MSKIKITVQIDDRKIEEEEQVEKKELKTKINRLFRRLKKKI